MRLKQIPHCAALGGGISWQTLFTTDNSLTVVGMYVAYIHCHVSWATEWQDACVVVVLWPKMPQLYITAN